MRNEVWLHESTFTIALVEGDFGIFYFNGKKEESYWGVFRESKSYSGWILIGDL